MIHFLFGRPGTGKTTRIVEEIKRICAEASRHVYLLVPERQAYSVEREVLLSLPPEAGRYLSVFSFSRLCETVADLYGGRAQHTVSRAMRSLLMWENLRELSGMMEAYAHHGSTDTSLCEKMLRAVDELKVNGVTPSELERVSSRLDPSSPLYGKLRDLALVSASYDRLLTDVFGENPSDRLLRAASQIEKNHFFSGSVVYIDSFTSFTMQEYAILRPLLEQASEVTVSFGCGGRLEPQPQFDSMKDAVRRVTRLCEDLGREYEDILLEESHRYASPSLLYLERELWNFDLTPRRCQEENDHADTSIRCVLCPDPYDEAVATALHVHELQQKGISFSEIAVVVRDTASWDGILDAAFEQYHIPFFLSQRTDLQEKPAARLLITALRCISRRFRAEDIMTLCKTGLIDLSLRDIDYFSEYIDTWKLEGRRMTEDGWSMNPDGYVIGMSKRGEVILEAANRVRHRVMTPLLELEIQLKAAKTVTEECRALYDYLSALDVRNTLTLQAEEYLRLGQVREAGEQVRLWSFLTETLATVATVMEEAEPLSPDELQAALSLVFSATDIGSVPARHDCVTVGSASTLRVDHMKAVLVLGLCEGEFPQSRTDDGLLTEQDKEVLSNWGVELSDRLERLTSDELLYVWRAFSKPSDALILSCSSSSADGQVRSPSVAFSRLKFLFPNLDVEHFSSAFLFENQTDRHRTPTDDCIKKATVRRLLGEEIWLSQSRLQMFSRCPYSYYGSHILRLREKVEAKFDNLGAGNFIHHVLEQYLRIALDECNRLRPMSENEVRETADAVILAYMQELCGDISQNGRLLHLFDRLRQIALMLIDSIQAELQQSAFRVAGLEWDTHGRDPSDPRPMCLLLEPDDDTIEEPLPTRDDGSASAEGSAVKLLLGGRIDRVDLYRSEDGEAVYVRVIDYKSSKHDFSVRSVTEDMNIQLLLYLFTLCSPENRALFADEKGRIPPKVLPASAVYISPDESDRDGALLPRRTGIILNNLEILHAANSDESITYLPSVKRSKEGSFTGKGLCSAQFMSDLEEILQRTIRDTASAMYDGRAYRTPSENACTFCRMKHSCGVCQM